MIRRRLPRSLYAVINLSRTLGGMNLAKRYLWHELSYWEKEMGLERIL